MKIIISLRKNYYVSIYYHKQKILLDFNCFEVGSWLGLACKIENSGSLSRAGRKDASRTRKSKVTTTNLQSTAFKKGQNHGTS